MKPSLAVERETKSVDVFTRFGRITYLTELPSQRPTSFRMLKGGAMIISGKDISMLDLVYQRKTTIFKISSSLTYVYT